MKEFLNKNILKKKKLIKIDIFSGPPGKKARLTVSGSSKKSRRDSSTSSTDEKTSKVKSSVISRKNKSVAKKVKTLSKKTILLKGTTFIQL